MTQSLDGTGVARQLRLEVADGVAELVDAGGRPPGLAAVLVGDDPASTVYVGSKARQSTAAGFESRVVRLPASVAEVQAGLRLGVVDVPYTKLRKA